MKLIAAMLGSEEVIKRQVREADGKGDPAETEDFVVLSMPTGNLPVKMAASDATALPLVSHDGFGADLIRFGPGECVEEHIHPGAHILFVMRGTGTLTYEDERHALCPGLVYMIPGNVKHAIYADKLGTGDLLLIAVGNDHKPAWSGERLTLVR